MIYDNKNRYPFTFDIKKSIQASGVVFRTSCKTYYNYMKLLSLLYLADRESIEKSARPIIGDTFLTSKRGPILSRMLNVIKGIDIEIDKWSTYFLTYPQNQIRLIKQPGIGSLNIFEIETLQKVTNKYINCDEFDLVEIVRELPEWRKNYQANSLNKISFSDILEGLGISDKEEEYMSWAEESLAVKQFFDKNRIKKYRST